MTSQNRGTDPIAVDHTFEPDTPKPPPAEHVGSPAAAQLPSPSCPQPTSSPRPTPNRLKSASISQPSRSLAASSHRHTASTATPLQKSVDLLQSADKQDAPSNDPDFLTLLAAQERRVLELKEELQRAEDDLRKLKRQWASHESSKRRNEGRRLHQLRPMSTTTARLTAWKDDPDGSSAWMYEEMERRKALMGRGRRSSRRVFDGSRTPRPLSLVASRTSHLPDRADPRLSLDERPTRSQTMADLVPEESDRVSPTSFFRSASSSPQRQSLYLAGSKQLASEWKEGLWTFFEDLKHATVGDEPRIGHNSSEGQHKRNSTTEAGKLRPTSNKARKPNEARGEANIKPHDDAAIIDVNGVMDTGVTIWNASGPEGFPKPPTTNPSKRTKKTPSLPLHTRVIDGETWDTWDSPDTKQPSSAHSSNNSFSAGNISPSPQASTPASSTTTSADATPRQSIGVDKPRESIPWPALTKLSPGQLRRTASNLMDEWEKSLVEDSDRPTYSNRPSKGEEIASPAEHLGLG